MVREEKDAVAFSLPASVTIRDIASICDALRAALAQGPDGSIDCTAVDEADITLCQVLAAAKLSAERAGRTQKITWPQDEHVLALLRLSGLFEYLH